MLSKLPERSFEIMGTIVGIVASLSVATQVHAELTTRDPTTLSASYTLGFLFVFVFWTMYGLRFKRAALWITNGLAAIMQAILLIVIRLK